MKMGREMALFSAVILALALLATSRGACVNKKLAIHTLEAQGYSNVEIVDHAWFAVGLRGCDNNDAARFTARAINPAGQKTEIYVCTGWLFKGGTIRVR